MSLSPDLDKFAIYDWCAANIVGFAGPTGISKFQTGQSNPTYRLDAKSGTYVLRAKPPGELLRSAHMVEREFCVMSALSDSPVPVPKTYGLAEDHESPIGRAFFVMEFMDGDIFWDPKLPLASKSDRTQIFGQMVETIAALHSLDPIALGLEGFGKPHRYFERQTERWSKQYLATKTTPDPTILRIIDWLWDHLPSDDGQISLIHGDYRLDNIIFATNEPRVIGLIDWELSTLGHPLSDLAYQCMQWRLPGQSNMGGLGGLNRPELGIPSEADYVAQYCSLRNIQSIDNWNFYILFAFFRLIAILDGVVQRARDGNASNPEKARQLETVIPELVSLAQQEMHQ